MLKGRLKSHSRIPRTRRYRRPCSSTVTETVMGEAIEGVPRRDLLLLLLLSSPMLKGSAHATVVLNSSRISSVSSAWSIFRRRDSVEDFEGFASSGIGAFPSET